MTAQPLHPAEALFDKCLGQSLSQEEQAQLDAWVCADPRNAEALARWLLAHAQTAEALALAEAPAVAGRTPPRMKPAAGRVGPLLQFALIAACLALAVGAGVWWLAGRDDKHPLQATKTPPAPTPEPIPQPASDAAPDAPPAIARIDGKTSTPDPTVPKITVPLLDDPMTATHIQRLLLAVAFLGGGAPSSGGSLVAQDTPAPAPADTLAEPPAGLVPPGTDVAADDGLVIPGLDKMSASIQGSRRAIARGDFGEAIKRLEELKTKRLKEAEMAAVTRLLDYAYANGIEVQLKNIEQADPLKALQMFNLLKPPGSPGPYAPRLKDRIAALEAKVRSPEAQAQVKNGHEFNALYDLFQTYPEDAKPKLEAFVAAHAGDPYGQMAQRVLEGKTPTEDVDIAVGGGTSPGAGLDQAQLLYPSEFGASKGAVPKSMAELRKTCADFISQSERALKAATSDIPECDAKFWKWVDSRPDVRTGLLLAKSPVPPAFAANLAKFRKKLGERACNKYAQLVLAASLTEEDATLGGIGYKPEDFSDNQRKLGKWLQANRDKVPFWRFLKDPDQYAKQAGCTTEGIRDEAKMAYVSHTFPPRVRSSRLQNVRTQILQLETQVPGAAWPLFPVAQTPYVLLGPVGACNEAMRDREYLWGMFTGRVGYPGNAEPGQQPGPAAAPRVGTRVQYGKYGFEYTRPDVEKRPSLWHPSNVIRIMEDGGVCGRMATSCSIGEVCLGIPSTPAGQPGHCALMSVSYANGQYGASIGQSVTGTWMNTGPGQLGVSPATAGHDHDAISWLALTRTVNRVGMQNYHASLVAAYLADAAVDPTDRRNWLELAVRLNPYHLAAVEKVWEMAAEGGINSLNKSIQAQAERMAVKKGKSFDELVLDPDDAQILRKLAAVLPKHFDTAMDRAGNVSSEVKAQEYKIGEGYVPPSAAAQTAEERALAEKAGVGGDPKKAVKQDLELMFRYMLAFQKKGLMYGFAKEVFLKHLSRVDRDIARKMLNQMLEDAFKQPIPPPESLDKGDCPLYVCIQGMIEMDSNLDPKDKAKGLAEICARLDKAGARLVKHNHPDLVYGRTIFVDDAQTHPIYTQVAAELDKALRASGVEGMKLADNAKRKYEADFAKLDYLCKADAYAKTMAILPRGATPPAKPVPPVFDKQGNLVKKDAAKDANSDAERRKRGEGVKG